MEKNSLFGLIGHPLSHSFSKAYFTEKFQREGIPARYENFDLPELSHFPSLLSQYPDLCGFNVTIPYKEAILPYLDEVDPTAQKVGAVNTVKVLPGGRLKGFNTDVIGIQSTLLFIAKTQNALILGTGGASKAVQYVLRSKNIPYHLVSRDPNKGDFTYQYPSSDGTPYQSSILNGTDPNPITSEVIQNHQLIINATPVGMAPNIKEAPAIPYEGLTPQHILFDLIYNPEETLFLKRGREHGAITINGLAMLHAQAEASWDIWNQ